MSTTKKTRPGPWTDAENAACLALYFEMHSAEENAQPYIKAAMIRWFRGEPKPQDPTNYVPAFKGLLCNRGRPSVEMKLMNLSAVFESVGRHDISMSEHGYRALTGYQASLKTMAVALLAVRDEAVSGGFDQVQA